MLSDDTRLVPIINAAGNHDFGVNSGGNVKIKHNSHEPLFKHYYPQNTHYGYLPSVHQRKSFHYHVFGNTTIVIAIDSGYDITLGGQQMEWLEDTLKKYSNLTKFVVYHEPIYPA